MSAEQPNRAERRAQAKAQGAVGESVNILDLEKQEIFEEIVKGKTINELRDILMTQSAKTRRQVNLCFHEQDRVDEVKLKEELSDEDVNALKSLLASKGWRIFLRYIEDNIAKPIQNKLLGINGTYQEQNQFFIAQGILGYVIDMAHFPEDAVREKEAIRAREAQISQENKTETEESVYPETEEELREMNQKPEA